MSPNNPKKAPATPVKLISANLQAGITTRRYSDYLTQSWSHVLPLGKKKTLTSLAEHLQGADIAGIQEADSGSLRSGFHHQTIGLSERAGFSHWHHQTNRKIGLLACSGNGILSRYQAQEVTSLPLPGSPGRGALLARYQLEGMEHQLLVGVVHLALGASTRAIQLAFLSELMQNEPYAVLMGDFNCTINAPEMSSLWRSTLLESIEAPATFPSWNPTRAIDHILTTPALQADAPVVLAKSSSDHLMISRNIQLPTTIQKNSTLTHLHAEPGQAVQGHDVSRAGDDAPFR